MSKTILSLCDYSGRWSQPYKDNGYGDESTLGLGRYPDGDDAEVENYALNVNYQLGDYTLTSVTGFSEYTVQSGSDVDWLPLRFIGRDDDQDYEQTSQEFRLTSPGGEFIDFVAGAYYDTSDLTTDRLVPIDGSLYGRERAACDYDFHSTAQVKAEGWKSIDDVEPCLFVKYGRSASAVSNSIPDSLSRYADDIRIAAQNENELKHERSTFCLWLRSISCSLCYYLPRR